MSGRSLRHFGVIGIFAPALLVIFGQASICHGSILAPSIGWDESNSWTFEDASVPSSGSQSETSRPEQDQPSDEPFDAGWQLCGNTSDGQMGSTSGAPIGFSGGLVALLPPVAELVPLHLWQRLAPEAALILSGPVPGGLFHPPRAL